MKKLLLFAALMLGLASCQTEPEGFDVNVGGEQDVNITVSLPEGTRANSAEGAFENVDFTKYDVRFQCEVHYGTEKKVLPVQYGRGNDAVATATFPVRLIANRDYTFVVWADLVAEGETADLHYNTENGLKQIVIKDWKAMDETRDAYTCSETRKFTRANGIGETLTLTRPFAKLRVVTTDMEELMGVEPTWATVEYTTPYYTSFNAYEQKPYDLTSNGKTHSELFDIVSYGESGASKTLFTDYFFAINPENGQAPETVAFTMEVFDENGATIDEPKKFNTSIPVKRNYLTTIKGNILTYADDFTVEIDPVFANAGNIEEQPYYQVAVTNGADLLKAISEGRKIIALNHIVATEADKNFKEAIARRSNSSAKNPVLNLNGFTITFVNDTDEPLITVAEGSSLTIVDEKGTGAIVLEGDGTAIENNGTLNIEGGSVESNDNGTVIVNKGEANIEGGKLNDGAIENNGVTNISGGELNEGAIENNGTTNVAGGKINEDSITNTTNGTTEITGGEFTYTPDADEVDDDYEVKTDENGKITIERKDDVAKIGEEGYTSIQKAVAAAQNGDTILFIADVEQEDGVIITDKNITIDLNDKTFTVSEGASTNNRNFKVNGSSVVTIKNGTLVAYGELTSGAYGTVRTEDTAVANLENLKLYSYRGYGLNVKACSGTTIKIKDSEIYAQYSGGVEAAGGNIELTNVKIDQTGVYSSGAWCSVAIGVNGGGKVTVNSGNYSASTISTDANAAQGTWVAYVMSSGGTLNIKGGTFNGVVAETASAANACGLICADTKAIVNIYGGTFSSNGAILDMRNNTGGTPNPTATLYAGTFSADPRVSGLYASNLITIDSKSDIKEENGKWVVFVRPVAKIGDVEYETLEAAVAAAKAGNTITLVEDVTLAEELEIPAGITLNGNGKQINGTIYAGGDLTFAGHTKVTAFSASYYDRVITIGEGACLEVTGGGRVSLAYGNTFNITGSIEDAKTADKAEISPSLIIPAGISITGGNNATMNVTNAYVQIGSTTSKPGAAGGLFTFNFDNSIAEFTKEFGFYDPTGGKNPTFVMNIENSVFTTGTKLYVTANSEVKVDNSVVTLGTYFRNSGKFDLANGSVMTGSTIQFGENGGNDGTITVDNSSFSINCGNSTGHAFDGKGTGSITATNGATVAVQYYKDMTINVDATSTFTGTDIYGNRKIYYTGDMELVPYNANAFGGATIVSSVFNGGKGVLTFDRDITTIGEEAFKRTTNTDSSNWMTSITLPNSVTTIGNYAFYQNFSLETINIPDSVTSIGEYAFSSCNAVQTVTIGSGVSTIGSGAFYNCYEIKEFNCKSATPPALADKWVFNGVDNTATVYVPAASVDTYKNAEVWRNFTNIVGK